MSVFKRLSPKFNIALMASAGTGKTYNLALRVAATLMSGSMADFTDEAGIKKTGEFLKMPAGKILCLTFTRKATAEMAERVQMYLTKLANGQFSSDSPEYLAVTEALGLQDEQPDVVRKLAAKAGAKIYSDSSLLQIRTIDSFTSYLLRNFPFEADVNPDYKILSELKDKELRKKAFKEAFRDMPDDKIYVELFFRYIEWTNEQPYKFTDRLSEQIGFIMERSIPLRNVLTKAAEYTPQDLLVMMNHAIDTDRAIRDELEWIITYLQPRALKISTATSKRLEFFEKIVNGDNISLMLKEIKVLEPSEVPAVKNKQRMSDEYMQHHRNLLKHIQEHVRLYEELDISILLNITEHVQNSISRLKKKQNMLSYSDLSRLVYNMLHSEERFIDKEYLYFRIDGKLEHILVDEFQDTSSVQWNILKPLVEEAMSGLTQNNKLGSFFCVGDSKQTIYRFRGSNPNFFNNVINEFDGRLEPDNLYINHRSDKNIVEFVNELFHDADFHIKDGSKLNTGESFFNYTLQTAKSDKEGFVAIKIASGNYADERKEAKLVMLTDIIIELMVKKWHLSDIAILTARRSDGVLVYNYLNKAGYSARLGFMENLTTRPAFKIVSALVKYIQKRDLLSLAEFLLTQPSLIKTSKITEENILHRYGAVLDKYLEKSDNLSIYERIMQIGKKLSLTRRLRNDADFSTVLEIIAQHMPALQNPADFYEKFYNIAAETSAAGAIVENSITVMTVHGSKGLQFPVVMLFDINEDFSLNINTKYFVDENGEQVMLRKRLNSEYLAYASSEYINAAEREKLLDRYEKINKLYVAATRAENILYILAEESAKTKSINGYILKHFPGGIEMGVLPEKPPVAERIKNREHENGKKFRQLCWYTLGAIDLAKQFNSGQETEKVQKLLRVRCEKLGYHKIITDRFIEFASDVMKPQEEIYTIELGEGFQNRYYGIFIHEILYQIMDFNNFQNSLDAAIEKAYKRYGGYLQESVKFFVKQNLLKLADSELWCDIISHGRLFREKAHFYKGQLIVIDLYVHKGDNIVVIDFKSAASDTARHAEYTEQLTKYIHALQFAYNLPVTGYIVYLHKDVEIVSI